MEKLTNVAVQLSAGGQTTIPLLYSISNEDGNENIKLISCKVKLPVDEIPEWLSPVEFIIRQVYRPGSYGDVGVTVTELGSIPCKNIDSATFVSNTHDQISTIEKIS